MRSTALLSLVVLAGCTVTMATRTEDPEPKVRYVKSDAPRVVRVALFRTSVAPALRQTIKQDKLWEMWRAEFSGDRTVSLVSQKKVDKAQRDEAKGKYNFFRIGDAVRVTSGVYHVMKTGYNRQTRKFAKVPVMVISATIEWKVAKRKETVRVEGSFFKNAELIKELAAKVKAKLQS